MIQEVSDDIKKVPADNCTTEKQNSMNYQDFRILLAEGKVRASSDQGEESEPFYLNTNEIDLALTLIEKNQTNSTMLKVVGGKLHKAIFSANILSLFSATKAAALTRDESVRIRLVFDEPKYAGLPWEFLYDERTDNFLANNIQTALSRYINIPLKKKEIKAVTLPLKVIVVISSPLDRQRLDATGEESLIREALKNHIESGAVELDVLHEATRQNISQKLREKAYNVFHFIGHGSFEKDQGFIDLIDQNGNAKSLSDETFSNFFLGNRTLGLVVLNSCQGASISSNRTFVGVAPSLVRRGIPAVVAMRYSSYDTTAKLFADEFYRTLALGWPVDAAIQTTRNAISMDVGLDKPDFATPVLYMRAKDGVILSGL
ncbi:MAG: CHAT domain-containing protein [Cyanobacteria bacterium P01_D01_bin.56]